MVAQHNITNIVDMMSFAEIEEMVTSLQKEEKLALIDKIWGTMIPSEDELSEEDREILKTVHKREANADESDDRQEWVSFRELLQNRDR